MTAPVFADRLGISWEGLRQLIADAKAQGIDVAVLLVSEHDKIDLKEELIATAKAINMQPKDYSNNYKNQIAFLDGVIIASHKDVDRGKARLIPRATQLDQSTHIIVK